MLWYVVAYIAKVQFESNSQVRDKCSELICMDKKEAEGISLDFVLEIS